MQDQLPTWGLLWTKGGRKIRKGKYLPTEMMKLTQESSEKDPRDGSFTRVPTLIRLKNHWSLRKKCDQEEQWSRWQETYSISKTLGTGVISSKAYVSSPK